ncbi:AAA family ATPase [Photobacterium damselae]|uniref:AAA family ATPase n=1 Tax=Photobacterium damselae TaxID=38293 RepID=UPI0040693830
MIINPDILFIGNSKTKDTIGNDFLTFPVFKNLTGISYDFQPRFLPEDPQSLEECLDLAFDRAKTEANRVITEFNGLDWDKLKREDSQMYLNTKIFVERYTMRLASVTEAEKHRDTLDVFGKFRLLNYLTMLCEGVIFEFRSTDWEKLSKQNETTYSNTYLFFCKYIQRAREVSIDLRKREQLDKIKTHINNVHTYMNEDYLIKPFVPATSVIPDSYSTQFNSMQIAKQKPVKDINKLQEELNSMIGLYMVKSRVTALVSEIAIRKEREAHGLPISERSYHMVFTGNAGTGKTIVARIISKMFFALGLTRSDKFIEATRGDLVGEYIGHTAIKTNGVVDSSLGGVLFIDEAYALKGEGNDFGKEAITTLLKRMEDDRNNLIVIMAGYENEMEELMESNQGLRSRLNRRIHFDDYDNNELTEILKLNFEKNAYVLDDMVSDDLLNTIVGVNSEDKIKFSNGRGIRNLFEKIIENQELRIYRNSGVGKLDKDTLQLIKLEDIASVV